MIGSEAELVFFCFVLFFFDKQGNQLLHVDIMRDSSYDLMHSTDSFDEWHWEGEYWYLLLIYFFSSPGWSQRARM